MHWPWKRRISNDTFVVSWADHSLAYVRATLHQDGLYEVHQLGVEHQGKDSAEDFARRLQGLGLKGLDARVMLRPEQYQLLQIDAPMVAPEEMRAAARWKIREMVDMPVDDITLDVMRVGDERGRVNGQLFVVAASNAVLREALRLGQTLRWNVDVLDIQETAQRNLQTALARRDGRLERADAALVVVNERLALLTISANEELFYTRRIDLGAGFMAARWGSHTASVEGAEHDPFASVPEYVPGYATASAQAGDDLTQRLVLELQRSHDEWDHTWTNLPLEGLRVRAGVRSAEMANWLSHELNMSVSVLDVDSMFPGFSGASAQDQTLCWPLLGALLRTENSKS